MQYEHPARVQRWSTASFSWVLIFHPNEESRRRITSRKKQKAQKLGLYTAQKMARASSKLMLTEHFFSLNRGKYTAISQAALFRRLLSDAGLTKELTRQRSGFCRDIWASLPHFHGAGEENPTDRRTARTHAHTHGQFECSTPMQPCRAIAIAILLSVTVSMAAEANGNACRPERRKTKKTAQTHMRKPVNHIEPPLPCHAQ